jgi:hypothetical protein
MDNSNFITADANIRQFLSANGDGTGEININGNYSDAGLGRTRFFIQPPIDETYLLNRLLVFIEDTQPFSANVYGKDIVLTNGIFLEVVDEGGVTHDLVNDHPVKSNAEWTDHCHDAIVSSYGSGNQALSARWSFFRSGFPLMLEGRNNDRLEAIFHDNFNGLVEHHLKVEGWKISG